MAIHHSAAGWIGVAAENCGSGITERCADFTDEGFAIFSGDCEGGAQTRKNCAGADWFRHSCSLVFAYGTYTSSDI